MSVQSVDKRSKRGLFFDHPEYQSAFDELFRSLTIEETHGLLDYLDLKIKRYRVYQTDKVKLPDCLIVGRDEPTQDTRQQKDGMAVIALASQDVTGFEVISRIIDMVNNKQIRTHEKKTHITTILTRGNTKTRKKEEISLPYRATWAEKHDEKLISRQADTFPLCDAK